MTDTVVNTHQIDSVRRVGRWLILAGILVWGLWLVVKLTGGQPQLRYFLPLHLLGVLPGSILSRWHIVQRWMEK